MIAYYQESNWLYKKDKVYINKIIVGKLDEQEHKTGPIINPFLATDINDIKMKMIKKLTEKLNLEIIFGLINEGDFTSFDKTIVPFFSDAHLEAANLLLTIAKQCTAEIIINDIKNEYYKYILLKEIVEPDICFVVTTLFIDIFQYI